MEHSVSLSHSEWLIMQEIWKRETATFREICDGVAGQNWSKPAVAAFLNHMEKKGHLL
ncbi:BlaI/MecI/CopY family transcriptional regulator [Pseudoflavonifractor sp. P01024]